ncbi:hypothetical protein [Chryseobacterium populi]|uniref:DUF3828 domain-containing protein n=1 Tax=Chryseobacterium populi TaxID=1144316 RepID=J3CAA9_9FLAO|nr:hypothetical protein [Chryseobacterium populi]EJL67504.1 hypothetical protein PMI13_04173 [Chryseobacterium populi]
MKHLIIYLGAFLLFTGCINKDHHSEEITEKLKTFYTTYGKSSDILYESSISKDLFSADLEKILQEAVATSKADIEKVKKSDHPTDKPLLLEGSIFTGLYEGFTAYKIRSIDVKENSKPLSANVTVDLENSNFPDTRWTDIIQLINVPDKGWRIDNIKFDTINGSGNLKTSLKNFVSGAEE